MRLKEDFKAFTSTGSGGRLATLLLNPNFHSVCLYRLSNLLHRLHLDILAKVVWYLNRVIYSVDIDYRADLAGGFVLVHGLGTVIGYEVVSKGRLTVYQHVTIGGGNGKPKRVDENGKKWGMPILGENTVIYTGAMVVGPILVGKNTMVKAGSIVTRDVDGSDIPRFIGGR